MKKQFLIFTILFLTINATFSQENFEGLQKQFKLDYSFLGAGISYEIPLAKKWTVDLSAGIGGGSTSANSFVWIINSSPAINLKSEFKYIYNRKKRAEKGKNNINNSGNYLAFQTKYTSKRLSKSKTEEPLHNTLLTEVHWGMQRSLGGNWLFNAHFGLGVSRDLDFNDGGLYPALGLKFLYILF
jgi:hypothetical protein